MDMAGPAEMPSRPEEQPDQSPSGPSIDDAQANQASQASQQPEAAAAKLAAAAAASRQECCDIPVKTSQLELAGMAETIVTGVVLGAGAGRGQCYPNGTLAPLPDEGGAGGASGTSFILLGLQCVHRGLVTCRSHSGDDGDCLILVEAPVLPDSQPCTLTGGQRYMLFLQEQQGPCGGYYYAMFQ
ncbi:hypothetical protein HYH03_018686, partial [Edaphochlamys debaryana]